MGRKRILITGSTGMLGRSLVRNLQDNINFELITPLRSELNLLSEDETLSFLKSESPELIISTAAKVGGIGDNESNSYDFLIQNLKMQINLINGAHLSNIQDLIFIGSSCVYPGNITEEIKEEMLLSGPLEKTNEAYAVAKIAGVFQTKILQEKFKRNYFTVMPSNLYGPYDNFSVSTAHVLPAMIHKFHKARINGESTVELWGDGSPKREFVYVDDISEAVALLIDFKPKEAMLNLGAKYEISIKELSEVISEIVGFDGEVLWDNRKPNGTMRKRLDSSRMKTLGWEPKTELRDGIRQTYQWFKENYDSETIRK